ncbi:hypothetical protein BURK2_02472 [Burkholderiales bacterium]|nr:MAG: hypothetical protein F9K47_03365 [Burkholderiales bacterium]CAG0992516.1 hypothetical protein BURK2_02472 [Burkholderiales bacterium]
MKAATTRRGLALIFALALLAACAAPGQQRAAQTFGQGVVGLILSPLMVVAGLAQGLAFLPYTLATGLDELNRGLMQAKAVSLEDSYKATYGVSLRDPRVDQRTGQVAGQSFGFGQHRPEAMSDATRAFQRLLISQGMPESKARNYVLVADYTHARGRGHILLGVVHRQVGLAPFRVRSKETGIVTTFRPENRGWSAPYERDDDGKLLDEVIDWAGVEYSVLQQDKAVAILMVIAAESIKSGKRSPEYWQIEKRWIAGETTAIMAESSGKVQKALAVR